MVKEISGAAGGAEGLDRVAELEQTLASLREDSEVAHVLLGLSGVLAEVRSVEDTLFLAVETVSGVFGADRCFAAAYTGEDPPFKILAHSGFESDGLEVLRRFAATEWGLPLLRTALETEGPVFVPDATKNPLITPEDARER
ncbi:MAG: hypothetical protein QOK47_253, partial [Actinomycetota bacterium]|nr:hypothetical protein [Actinomycetota bacterium]